MGYGVLTVNGRHLLAHRYSMELALGHPIERGMAVCHRCDNPPCVRPDHLFLGTLTDNDRDMRDKGRDKAPPHFKGQLHYKHRKTHCPNGHAYSGELDSAKTKRICRICRRAQNAAYLARKRAA